MNRSRKKPLRTYGRKKKVHYVKTVKQYVQNNTFLQVLVVNNPSEFKEKQPEEKCNLFEMHNSSAERKFDLLVGKKPTSVFSSSNSSLSTSEQLSGLKGSSFLSSLGSIHENVPLASFSRTDLEKRVAKVSPSDDAKNSFENCRIKVIKHVFQVTSKAKNFRVSNRFSLSRGREKIGNSTPIERRIKEMENTPAENWGLSPIAGTIGNDSLHLSTSPDIFGSSDSDDEKKSRDDNHLLPKINLRRKKRSFKRLSIMHERNRKSTFQQAVEKNTINEVQNDSVISCLADLSNDQETSILLSENKSITSSDDGVDDQLPNNGDDISLNELSHRLSKLEVEVLPDKCDAENCNEHVSDVEDIIDDSLVHNSQIDESRSIIMSLKKSNSRPKRSPAESTRIYGSFSSQVEHEGKEEEAKEWADAAESTLNSTSCSVQHVHSKSRKSFREENEESTVEEDVCQQQKHESSADESDNETENEDAAESTINSSSCSVQHVHSKCSKNIEEEKEESEVEEDYTQLELENSAIESDKESENEDSNGSVKFQDSPINVNTGKLKLVDNDLEEEDEDCDEKEDSDEEEYDNYEEDFEEKEDEDEGKTINVLDPDNSLCMAGFELDNDCTFDFLPGKKYRRSLAALRLSRSSAGNMSVIGCNRHSIIRPSAKLKASTRMTLITTTIEECFDETVSLINVDEDKNAAKHQVLSLCQQREILNFESVLRESPTTEMRKIGEGVYGEVFMIKNLRKMEESNVVKIIPVEGSINYNGEVQKRFHEIISEIYISQALSNLKKEDFDKAKFWTDVYCNIIASNCFQGKYPKFIVDLWDKYNETNDSENDRPTIFPQDQLYISLKMSHGGGDIQNHEFASARQAYYILMQVIFALAVAEKALEFEHRDLHIGNILVSKTKEKSISFKIDSMEFKLPTFWKKATIIDYTLSRINSENLLFYNDLEKDEELFLGQGDLQFQVYRDMRMDTGNKWQNFEPKTNVRWIHYLANKSKSFAYSNKSSTVHASYIKKLNKLADEVPVYSSCHDYIMNSEDMIQMFHKPR